MDHPISSSASSGSVYNNHLLDNQQRESLISDQFVSLENLKTVGAWSRNKILGSGFSGKITLWVNTKTRISEKIAIKECKPFDSESKREYFVKQWKQEIEIMKRLDCPNVVKGYTLPAEFGELSVRMPLLAMEYCSGGDLRTVLNKPHNCCGLEEFPVRQMLSQISNAILYLHENDIVHRDVKPENILLYQIPHSREIVYKLTDLGYAKELTGSTMAKTFVGTWEYLAPEFFEGTPQTSNVDNWSFGSLAFEVITGRRPFFYSRSMDEVLRSLRQKRSEYICLEIDIDKKEVCYSKEIPQVNFICTALKNHIENWLKIVLEYAPDKRGGNRAFQKIKDIVETPMITIFNIVTYESFSVPINSRFKLDDIKDLVRAKMDIDTQYQYFVMPDGKPPVANIGKQILETWFSSRRCIERYNPLEIVLLDYSQSSLTYRELHHNIALPSLVEGILIGSTIDKMPNDFLKKAWKEAIWVSRDMISKHRTLQRAFKTVVLNTVHRYNCAQSQNQKLVSACNEVLSLASVLRSTALHQIRSQNLSVLPEEQIYVKVHNFKKNIQTLNLCKSVCRSDVMEHLKKSSQTIPKFDKEKFLFDGLFTVDIGPATERNCQQLVHGYEQFRKRRPDQNNNSQFEDFILERIVAIFTEVEIYFAQIIRNMSVCLGFLKKIDENERRCAESITRIGELKKHVLKDHLSLWNSDPTTGISYSKSMLQSSNSIKIALETFEKSLASFSDSEFENLSAASELQQIELRDLFF